MQGVRATNRAFAPMDTVAERFRAVVGDAATLGFTEIDVQLSFR